MEIKLNNGKDISEATGLVLVVDDDDTVCKFHRAGLITQFDVQTANSGEQAVRICKNNLPDLVLLDVIMPEMDGYETCRKLREFTDIPIIFVTENKSIDGHLQAFDVGGDDIVVKPIIQEVLLRKVALSILRKNEQSKLLSENISLSNLAMHLHSPVEDKEALKKFIQASLTCNSYNKLGNYLVEAINNYGLKSRVLIRAEDDSVILTSHEEPSAIETILLEQSFLMGEIFQFKQKLVVNHDRISVIVTNMPPEEHEYSGKILDNITMLVEMTEAMCENVDVRQVSMRRAENTQISVQTAFSEASILNDLRRDTQVNLRLLLQELVDKIEKSYSWMGTSRAQEEGLSGLMYESVEKILSVLETTGDQYDKGFDSILSALRSDNIGGQVQLF